MIEKYSVDGEYSLGSIKLAIWCCLHIIVLIYAGILIFYARNFRKTEILSNKNIIDDRKSHIETSERTRRFTTRIDVSNSSRISRYTDRHSKLNITNKIVPMEGIGYSVALSLLVLIVMLVMFFRKKVSNYLNKRKRMYEVYDEYDRKRECRNGLRYHFDWALSGGENQSATNIGNEIIKMDKELKELYKDYQFIKEKGIYPLKNL